MSQNPSDTGNSKKSQNVATRYKGLFTSQMAPTSRAYCILFSFFVGVLMITAGSVFYHVNLIRPMSGIHPMHTPPLPLAIFLIAVGIITILAGFGVACRLGFDDGDDSLEDDQCAFANEDILDQHYQGPPKTPPA